MKTKLSLFIISAIIFILSSSNNNVNAANPNEKSEETYSWTGKYPMSFFTKTRTAKTVDKGRLFTSIKYQLFDWDLVKDSDGNYHSRTSGQEKKRSIATLCIKYGWAKDHHIALGVPYWSNDFNLSSSNSNNSSGIANIYIFDKWNFIKETNNIPGVAVDLWYYFPNGNTDRKLGNENGAYKLTTEISKSWEYFSVHFNPGYTWSEDKDSEIGEVNAGAIFKPTKTLWPAIEYNYIDKEELGHSQDLVPGMYWKFTKDWTFKAAAVINLDSTFTDKEDCGVLFQICHKW